MSLRHVKIKMLRVLNQIFQSLQGNYQITGNLTLGIFPTKNILKDQGNQFEGYNLEINFLSA